jgi:hypothetical protein
MRYGVKWQVPIIIVFFNKVQKAVFKKRQLPFASLPRNTIFHNVFGLRMPSVRTENLSIHKLDTEFHDMI